MGDKVRARAASGQRYGSEVAPGLNQKADYKKKKERFSPPKKLTHHFYVHKI